MLNKVPEVTALFWVIKVLATTVGQTFTDVLSTNLGLGLSGTTAVMTAALLGALVVQFRTRRYVPAVYWLAVVLFSVVGTLLIDDLTDRLGVDLAASILCVGLALGATFVVWRRLERTLSIHSIDSTRREAFYWLAVLCTFALGTAAGDWLAARLYLGSSTSLLVFGAGIGVVALAYSKFDLDPVAAFWIAYVLTRPLGASAGDLLAQPPADGGLGLGTTATSCIFLGLILAVVVGFTVQEHRRAGPWRSAH
jgi:uncharacterized membrane-anchored protein